ncbi:MAG: hypothetical protein ABIJ81_01195 [Patescibacteria group bacterium]
MKYFSYIIIAIVAIAVIAGFFIVGSPTDERLRRADEQRVSDLENIQWQIINYWQSKEQLPATLDDLIDNISGWRSPLDPETGTAYDYEVTGDLSFNLCSNFNLVSEGVSEHALTKPLPERVLTRPFPPVTDNWQHPAGKHCFERTIDPDLYKPIE